MSDQYLVTRWEPISAPTVAAVLAWCEEKGLDPAAVTLVSNKTVKWTQRETDEEREARHERHRAREERQVAWELEQWMVLNTKYGEQKVTA